MKEAESGRVFYDETLEYVILAEKGKFSKEIEQTIDDYIEKFKIRFDQLSIFCYFHDVMATSVWTEGFCFVLWFMFPVKYSPNSLLNVPCYLLI